MSRKRRAPRPLDPGAEKNRSQGRRGVKGFPDPAERTPRLASRRGARDGESLSPMSSPHEPPRPAAAPVDLDEDLFGFDQVAAASPPTESEGEEDLERIFDELRQDAVDDLFGAAPPAPASPGASERTGTVEPAHAPRPALAEPAPGASVAGAAPSVPAPAPAIARRAPRGLVAICAAVTVLNAAVALVALRGRPTPPVPPPAAEDPQLARAQPAQPAPEPFRAGPEALDPAHAHPTLDEAREELARGEYSSARRRVYGLLAVVDRLEDPRRAALEADCQFLIAQSLHLEALERMGGPR